MFSIYLYIDVDSINLLHVYTSINVLLQGNVCTSLLQVKKGLHPIFVF